MLSRPFSTHKRVPQIGEFHSQENSTHTGEFHSQESSTHRRVPPAREFHIQESSTYRRVPHTGKFHSQESSTNAGAFHKLETSTHRRVPQRREFHKLESSTHRRTLHMDEFHTNTGEFYMRERSTHTSPANTNTGEFYMRESSTHTSPANTNRGEFHMREISTHTGLANIDGCLNSWWTMVWWVVRAVFAAQAVSMAASSGPVRCEAVLHSYGQSHWREGCTQLWQWDLMVTLSSALLGHQATGTMTCYPTQSHYPDPEWTNHCPILIMPSTRLGSDK